MTDPIPSLEPSVPVTPSVPANPAPDPEPTGSEPQTPATPVAELYDLPDGRKVDGATLAREWKENFMPDYTRKSQIAAQVENINKPPENIPEWKKEGYVPKSYDELIERGAELALTRLQDKARSEQAQMAEVSKAVDTAIAGIKAKDPKLDENALFHHANKFGFRDLNQAYENMKLIKQIELDTEARVLKSHKLRQEPVSGAPGATVPTSPNDPNIGQKYGSALEFLQRLKG